jgi:hypothetical protein
MKSIFLLLGSGLLAATLAVAQDTPSNGSEATEPSPNTQVSKTDQTSSSVIRGCLSGSAGNYTITDLNGMQYTIAGPDNELQARVGHEIEVTTRQEQSSQSTSQGDQTTSGSSSSVQVSNVRDVSATCKVGSSTGTSPMNENGASPKGTASTSEPPQMMAMLEQQSAPDAGMQEQKAGSAAQQTTPPVTNQTPAAAAPPTASDQQTGSRPANTTGATGSEAGNSAGSDANNQGVNNSGTTEPNTASTSPNSATPSNTQQPQSNADDSNKPLYERQATDIAWANHSGANTGTSNPPH